MSLKQPEIRHHKSGTFSVGTSGTFSIGIYTVKLEILAAHLITAAKRLFGIPNFRLYALADGIREVFARSPRLRSTTLDDLPQLTLGFR